jgi:hypothetical protein
MVNIAFSAMLILLAGIFGGIFNRKEVGVDPDGVERLFNILRVISTIIVVGGCIAILVGIMNWIDGRKK